MRVDLFDFELPQERIALRPIEPREAARLLVVGPPRADHTVGDLPGLLRAGDVLVVNDTRVIPARLAGTRIPRRRLRAYRCDAAQARGPRSLARLHPTRQEGRGR